MDKNNQGLSAQSITSFFQEEGYQAKLVHGEERSWIESATLGMKFRIYIYSPIREDGETLYQNFMFDAGHMFTLATRVDHVMDLCNRFNAEFRFLKAFVITENGGGYVCLQLDEMFGAYGREKLVHSFGFYQRGLELFIERIIRSSAFQGDKVADKHNAAIACMSGSDMAPERGVALYREAAHEGFAGSQNNLGDLYETGKWVPSSSLLAAYWYARSAERGEPTAYLSLATLLEANACDEEMLVEAMKFAILAVNELPEGKRKNTATNTFNSLEERLSEERISEANMLSESWVPLYNERRRMSEMASLEAHETKKVQLLN